jgi:hypothetical protein
MSTMVVHRNPRWERSSEKLDLEVTAIERYSANPLLILAELNDATVELTMASMRRERRTKGTKLEELRKVLNAGRRDL